MLDFSKPLWLVFLEGAPHTCKWCIRRGDWGQTGEGMLQLTQTASDKPGQTQTDLLTRPSACQVGTFTHQYWDTGTARGHYTSGMGDWEECRKRVSSSTHWGVHTQWQFICGNHQMPLTSLLRPGGWPAAWEDPITTRALGAYSYKDCDQLKSLISLGSR